MWSIFEFEHRNIEQNFPFRINHDGKMDFIREDIPSDFPCCIWQTKIFAIIIFFFLYTDRRNTSRINGFIHF